MLEPRETWQVAADGCPTALHLSSNLHGEVFFDSASVQSVSNRAPNAPSACGSKLDGSALAFGPNGRVYRASTLLSRLPEGTRIKDFVVRNDGDVYATAEAANGTGQLWRLRPNGEQQLVDAGLKAPSGIAFSPDGLWLFVAQQDSRFGMSYRVRADGQLDAREPFYDLYVPAWADESGAEQVAMDKEGRAYVATRMGVQVFDRNGRVTAILPLPRNKPATGLCFGGRDFNTLYVASDGKIFKRKLRIAGSPSWSPPLVLPPWGAG